MSEIGILEILKLGLTGLGFLLFTLSYNLLKTQANQTSPNQLILKEIRIYTFSCLVLVLTVGVFTYLDYQQKAVIINKNRGPWAINSTNYSVDLTNFHPLKDEDKEKEEVSLVTVVREDDIEKENGEQIDYSLPLKTTGKRVDVNPIKSSVTPIINVVDEKYSAGTTKSYVIKWPLGKSPMGYTEKLMTNLTFVNGYRSNEGEWLSAAVPYPTSSFNIRLNFPAGKPCKSINVYIQEGLKEKILQESNQAVIFNKGQSVTWTKINIPAECRIWMEWKW